MEELFYKNGLYFGCARCSFCCGHSPGFVYLSFRDLNVLCAYFCMGAKDFVNTYCRWADYYEGKTVLALKEKANYDCIFWNEGCSCYKARPIQCSTFPFWSWILSSKVAWNECAADCKGMGNTKGRLWSFKEIERAKNAYEANIPLTKEEFENLICR